MLRGFSALSVIREFCTAHEFRASFFVVKVFLLYLSSNGEAIA